MFNKTKKRYKQELKRARNEYRSSIATAIENGSFENPKRYWELLEELKTLDQVEDPKCNPISDKAWVDHYPELLKPHDIHDNDSFVKNTLRKAENTKIFNSLRFRITDEEIAAVVKELKCGKASGPDGITAEIVKACCPVLLPYLGNLFNQILSTGTYPKAWGQGIVTSIHNVISKFNGTPTPKGSYSAKTGVNCTMSLSRVY